MRIVIDVTPLSHPRTGVRNYMLGMLRGLAEVAEGRHELVLFAPTGPRNAIRLRSALNEIPGDRRLVVVPPPSNVWRKLWSRGQRLPVEWLVGGLDVFHFSDWMYPPQRGGLRTTTVHDLIWRRRCQGSSLRRPVVETGLRARWGGAGRVWRRPSV